MSAPIKRIVGWFGKEDWDNVYCDLFSNDSIRQRYAVNRIAVWKCRVMHRLSSGIECTWQMMSALIMDRESQLNGNSYGLEQQIRMAYAMALVRFVNHMTDKGHTKGYVQPVHVIAEELGLPAWLVEMRHDATHASLPGMPLLRSATQYALAWIKCEYWDVQAADDLSGDEHPVLSKTHPDYYKNQITDCLITFMQEQLGCLNESSNGSNVKQALDNLNKLLSKHSELGATLLASEGYLLQTAEQLQAMDIDVPALVQSSQLMLPKILVTFWQPVLQLFQSRNLLPLILQRLSHGLSENGTLTDRLRAGWIATIMTSLKKPGKGGILKADPDDLDGSSLLQACLNSPNMYTSKLVECLLRNTSISLNVKQQSSLLALLRCFKGRSDESDECIDISGDIHTLESLLTAEENTKKVAYHGRIAEDDGMWQLATDVLDWASYPIGCCPDTTLTFTCLELNSCVDRCQSAAELRSDDKLNSMMDDYESSSGPSDEEFMDDNK